MKNSLAVAIRLLQQMKHEKRTLALMLVAPIVMLTLVYLIFSDMELPTMNFDKVGASFLGIIVYFFVFLVAGINLLDERISGMLERLLVTPIRRSHIVIGYFFGFGAVTVVQSLLLSLFYIYVLDITMMGEYWLVLVIVLLAAFNALTLGMLVRSLQAAANLAVAMDARGFSTAYRRTWWAPAPWRRADTIVVLCCLLPLGVAVLG
jgi:ABC-2 type transport system permease protein